MDDQLTQTSPLLRINDMRDKDGSMLFFSASSSLPAYTRVYELRKIVFTFLHDPHSSTLAWYGSLLMGIIVFGSAVAFVISSLPFFWYHHDTELYAFETITISIFTAEYIISLLTAPSWRWIIEPLSIVDLLAIVPFYVELFDQSLRIRSFAVLRVVRLVRMLWLLKFAEFSSSLATIGETFKRSGEAMVMLTFLLGVTTTIYSSVIFFAEQTVSSFDADRMAWVYDHNNSETPFQSIFHSMWWCVITLTTVGYGDMVPYSVLGKIIASCVAVTGAIVLAFPVTILGVNIVSVREEYKKRTEEEKWNNSIEKKMHTGGLSESSALAAMQEEFEKSRTDISSIENILVSLHARQERLSSFILYLKEHSHKNTAS